MKKTIIHMLVSMFVNICQRLSTFANVSCNDAATKTTSAPETSLENCNTPVTEKFKIFYGN